MNRLVAAVAVPLVALLTALMFLPGAAPPDPLRTVTRPLSGTTARADVPRLQGPLPERAASPATRSGRRSATSGAQEPESLAVTIDAMTPSVLPRQGPLVLQGSVTNTTDETWVGLNMHPFLSYSPMQNAQELRASAESDPEIFLGERIVTPGVFDDSIEALAPDATARWQVRIPQAELASLTAGVDGVYWVGVHALGADSDGRDSVADGRARTFIPRVSAGEPAVPTSLVIPIRHRTLHEPDGSLRDPAAWAADFSPDGRLSNILDLAEASGGAPLTFAIDPAVLDAATRIAAGNPPRSLEPTIAPPDGDQPEEDEEEDEEEPAEEPADPTPAQVAAERWLTRLTAQVSGNRVLALPYGDLDVAGAFRSHEGMYETSRALSDTAFEAAGITATPAVVPPSGLIHEEALDGLGQDTLVMVSDRALPRARSGAAPAAVALAGRRIEVYDAAASSGGPRPGDRLGAVALRQRVLAEAAVRSLDENGAPLVVRLPHDFDPGPDASAFFDGLDRPFVDLVPVGASGPEAPEVEELDYPRWQEDRELGAPSFAAAQSLADAGRSLDSVLPENDTLARATAAEAMTGASYLVRGDRAAAVLANQSSAGWVRGMLARVSIDAPSFVIFSAASGPFAVTVRNGLDQRVNVHIEAHTRDDLVIRAPAQIELAPESRQTINLSAEADSIGVHPVELVATDEDGSPIGAVEEISIRFNNTGRIIWVVMGAGVGILFLAILVRLVRRIRKARA